MVFVPGTCLSLSQCAFLGQSHCVVEQLFKLSSSGLVSVAFESCARYQLPFTMKPGVC